MAKFVPLKFWLITALYLGFAATPLSSNLADAIAGVWPQAGAFLRTFLSTRILVILISSFLLAWVTLPGWRVFWRLPVLGKWLSGKLFPDLQGIWEVTLQSNWPIIDQMREAAKSQQFTFDPLNEEETLPKLTETKFNIEIRQSWFRTEIKFLPNAETPLLESETISVEFFRKENGKKSVAWVFKAWNKQSNDSRLALTDVPFYHGAAKLNLNPEATELNGGYWQDRSWHLGLNAAGLIKVSKIESRFW
jgi:hypothetical protein